MSLMEGDLIGFLKTNPACKPTQDPPALYVFPFAGLCIARPSVFSFSLGEG